MAVAGAGRHATAVLGVGDLVFIMIGRPGRTVWQGAASSLSQE